MLEKRNISRNSETDPCVQLANGLVVLAEKELSAFISAVDKLFGAKQARQSALDWIEELELMDWPSGESIPDWRRATLGASARLGTLMSSSGEPPLAERAIGHGG
jgi:hypothetical protein